MFYELAGGLTGERQVCLPASFAAEVPVDGRNIPVRAGSRESVARVRSSNSGGALVSVSGGLDNLLELPRGIKYQIAFRDGALEIGPVVGLLVAEGHIERPVLQRLPAAG
jgi:hypothetical protein